MTHRRTLAFVTLALVAFFGISRPVVAKDDFGLETGAVALKSAGPLAFGPPGILFVADPLAATVYAIDTGDRKGEPDAVAMDIDNIDAKLAGMLGIEKSEVNIVDLAVNPATAATYLSVSRGRGPQAEAVLAQILPTGEVEVLDLENVTMAKSQIPNPPDATAKDRRGAPLRTMSVTDLAFLNSQVVVAGLSNEEFASNLRSIPFPFQKSAAGTSVEIFHGAHGRYETNSPVRTLAPITIQGEAFVVAAYTCTPLVKFPLSKLKSGEKVRGVTVAELGNRNRPLDMVVYERDDKEFILMANSARGVMKISTEDIERAEGIEERIQGTAGQPYETVDGLNGVVQLDRLNQASAVILMQMEDGARHLKTIALP